MNTYVQDCLDRNLIFLTGKGGVGKSTLAWSTALLCRRLNKRVAVISWNPFDAAAKPYLQQDLGIDYYPLDTLTCFREYALKTLRFEKIYETVFENHVLKTFIRAAPGLSETVIAGKILDLREKKQHDLLVVDLPASGHAVSFFQSPHGIRRLFPVGFVHKEASQVCEMFIAPQTRVDIVCMPEELPLVEGRELKEKLGNLFPLHFGYLHLNQTSPDLTVPNDSIRDALPASIRDSLDLFVQTKRNEEELIPLIDAIDLPTKKIPRFPCNSAKETVERVADTLKGET